MPIDHRRFCENYKNKQDRDIGIGIGIELLKRYSLRGVEISQSEIAAFCGISPQAVEQIERKALKKLRKYHMHTLKEL